MAKIDWTIIVTRAGDDRVEHLDFMLNFAVDDLSAILDRLKARAVVILKRDDSDPSGRFAWILDPDETNIELWEPKAEGELK